MALNRDLRLLGISLFFWAMGEGAFIFVLPLYMESLGADAVQIGLMYSLSSVAMAVALIPAGLASDKFGPRSSLIAGWAAGVLAGAIMAIATSQWWFAAGWILYGLTGWVIPPINAYITNARGNLPPERALTGVFSMFNAGLIISPTLGGYIGEAFGLRANFVFATAMYCISTAILLFLKYQPPHPAEHRPPFGDLVRNNHYLRFMGLVAAVMTVLYLAFAMAPKFLSDVKSVSIEQIGWIGTAGALGGVILNQLLGRRPPRQALVVATSLIGLYCLLLLQAGWVGWFGLAFFLRASYSVTRAMVDALLTRIVTPAQLGIAFAVSETIMTAANALAPYAAGWMYTFSPALPFQIVMLFIPLAASAFWIFSPREVNPSVATQPAAD